MRSMTAEDVRTWIAEIRERGNAPTILETHQRIGQLYRAVLESVMNDPTTKSSTRATIEEALTL